MVEHAQAAASGTASPIHPRSRHVPSTPPSSRRHGHPPEKRTNRERLVSTMAVPGGNTARVGEIGRRAGACYYWMGLTLRWAVPRVARGADASADEEKEGSCLDDQ